MTNKQRVEMKAEGLEKLTGKTITIGSRSSDYTLNKYIIISNEKKDFYSASDYERKSFQSWKEAEIYLSGLVKGLELRG